MKEMQVVTTSSADPGSGAFLTPGSGTGKKSGSGMNNPDNSESLKNTFSGLKYLNSLMWIRDMGMEKIRIRDPGWKKVGSGIGVPGKHPGYATQIKTLFC